MREHGNVAFFLKVVRREFVRMYSEYKFSKYLCVQVLLVDRWNKVVVH